MSQNIFAKIFISGAVSLGFVLSACSSSEQIYETEESFTAEEVPVYLTEQYMETYEIKPSPVKPVPVFEAAKTGVDLSASKPSEPKALPIKEKSGKVLETKENISVSAPMTKNRKQNKAVNEKEVITTISQIKNKKQEKKISELDKKVLYGEEVHDWSAAPGETLRSLLMQWGEQAGWTVAWKLDRDYPVEAGVVFRGSFTEVAGALIRSFARSTPAPIGTFYKGNRVLVINTQEDENAN